MIRIAALVIPLLILAIADARPLAAASGSAFEVRPVIEEIKRQLGQVNEATAGGLRIEDAQLDLALVESLSGKGAALVVPAADYVLGTKEETLKPALKRRVVVDIQPGKTPAIAAGNGNGGRLAQAVGEVRQGVQQALAADPGFDLKRFTLDLDFALERDAKGTMQLILFARDRRIDATNVHGLKLRLAADTPARPRESRSKEGRSKDPGEP
jgi:hypothetical protein